MVVWWWCGGDGVRFFCSMVCVWVLGHGGGGGGDEVVKFVMPGVVGMVEGVGEGEHASAGDPGVISGGVV